MKTKTKMLIAAAAVTTIAGLAIATPVINLAAGVVGAGSSASGIEARGVVKLSDGSYYRAHAKTDGATTVTTTLADYTAGGQNGWHSHPGFVIVTLTKGSIQWYNDRCELTVYNAGESWMEGSQTHFLRVLGATTVQFVTTFVVAQGEPNRIDEPAPSCAASLGLN